MARPRKDSRTPDARRRIIDAFWELLETNPLAEVSDTMASYIHDYTRNAIHWISVAQDMPEEEMLRRLREQAQPERIAELATENEKGAAEKGEPTGTEVLGFAC